VKASKENKKRLTLTKVFFKYARAIKRIVVSRGGTRSSKTFSAGQLAAIWLLDPVFGDDSKPFLEKIGCDLPKKGVWSFVRKTLPSLKASAHRDFCEALEMLGHRLTPKENKTELTFEYEGRMVEFFSIDQQQKVRSRKRAILYVVEANEIDFKNDWQQLIFRTTHRAFLDFNPDDEDIWINTELEQKRQHTKKDVEVFVSTYKDNPYLEQTLVDEIEFTKENDPELWQVYGLGEYGKITGLIYPNQPELIESFPFEKCKKVLYGLDFGYTDPMALVRIGIDELDIYIEELYYERHKLVSELIERFPDMGIEKNASIYADSANPGQIQEIYNAGYRGVKPAQKGKDSVLSGIKKMKKYRWHVVASSSNLLYERRRYKWAVDKNGEIIKPEKPNDGNDHALDASRYSVYTHTYKPKANNRTEAI